MNGNIVLCFERGEEGGGQIANLLPYIVETMKLPIDTCIATHVKWDVPAARFPQSRAQCSPAATALPSA